MERTNRNLPFITTLLFSLLLLSILALSACSGSLRPSSEPDQSAFGVYADSLDTLQLHRQLQFLISTDTSRHKACQAVADRYAQDPSLIWSSPMGVSPDADSLLALLRREVPLCGFDTTAFFVPQIAADLDIVHHLTFDSVGRTINEVLPHLDYCLSKAFVRYTTGQRYGFFRPDKAFNRLDHKAHSTDPNEYARLFDYDIKTPDYAQAVAQLASPDRIAFFHDSRPTHPVYQQLQSCLDTVVSQSLRQTLAVNMERCRWQIKHPSASGREVLVNLAAQQLWAVCPDSVLVMRICCGAQATKTPLLYSEFNYLQVNPDWIIPHNIVKNEVAPHGEDSNYFARNNYYIVEKSSGDTLQAADVSPDELRSGNLTVGQHGGPGNSLGRIVFRFPNNFSVYLHDTNNRNAFNGERRTLSHGCVRVQKPFELACFLLPDADEWLQDRLRLSMDIKPVSERGKKYLKEHQDDKRPFRLIAYHSIAPKVPLYIVYFTAYPNPENHQVEYYRDIYGYDRVILKELSSLMTRK